MDEPPAVTPSIPARLKLLLEDPGICTAMYHMFGDGRIGPALTAPCAYYGTKSTRDFIYGRHKATRKRVCLSLPFVICFGRRGDTFGIDNFD